MVAPGARVVSYARTDDGFYAKPAVLETNLEALGLAYLARVYCADQQTDGRISAAAVVMLARSSEQAALLSDHLCATGLWVREAENFRDAQYLTDNPSSREVEKAKKAAKLRMRSHRSRSSEPPKRVRANKRRTNAFVLERSGEELVTASSSASEGESEGKRKPPTPDDQARGLLELVNATGGTHFEPVESNLKFLRARLAEYDDWTLAAMVLRQWATWKAKPEMRPYFRPATLFNAEKCAQYVGQLTDTDRAWIARKKAQGAAA
jgi:uncharacterized phage protein (TIGR02220 family)